MKREQEDVTFLGKCTFFNIPSRPSDILKNLAIPSVSNLEVVKGSGSVVTITNFLGGADGQYLRILGDGTTTIANNTNIFTNTGAAKLLAANKIYRFTYIGFLKAWYEDA